AASATVRRNKDRESETRPEGVQGCVARGQQNPGQPAERSGAERGHRRPARQLQLRGAQNDLAGAGNEGAAGGTADARGSADVLARAERHYRAVHRGGHRHHG
uniref:Uncharacterized protein n=1 Tax=Anopheles coluzzii TaxID=1518534 RepID=A0A6E8W851_ANOCL